MMMSSPSRVSIAAIFTTLAACAPSAFAAALAYDDASDAVYPAQTQSYSALSGGTGFQPWIIGNPFGTGGAFIGTSAENGFQNGDINQDGKSWGLYAASGGLSEATRPFVAGGLNGLSSLAVGEQVSVRFDNGWVQNGGAVGISLRTASDENRFEFLFIGGGSKYAISSGTDWETQHGFTSAGMTLKFTLTGVDEYQFEVDFGGQTFPEIFTGSLDGPAGSGIDRLRFFNYQSGLGSNYDAYINNLQVVPEPSSAVLLMLGGVVGLMRRRR